MDLRSRIEELAAKLGERPRPQAPPAAPALGRDYWAEVQELFTRDVTGRGFDDLLRHETADTLRFFRRSVDQTGLAGCPWYQRWPLLAWRYFQTIAYRLSPPRRVLFAAAVPILLLAWLRVLVELGLLDSVLRLGFTLTLLAGTALAVLLMLELRDKLGLKGDLEVARQIQFGLLPFAPVARGSFSVRAYMRPANTVGGDYFDVIDLGPGRLALVIGDVAGKGMPAALLMALLQGSLRTLVSAGFRGADLVSKLNDHLCANIPSNRLITLFVGELDTALGELLYVNAGHNPPYLLRGDGGLESLESNAVALGVVAGAPFEVRRARLDAGERLLLYTDGVPEAFDTREQEYGDARLRDYLDAHRQLDAQALIDGLVADVLAFSGPARPRDDMTLLVVSRAA